MIRKILAKIGKVVREAENGKEKDVGKLYILLFGGLAVFEFCFLSIFSRFAKPNDNVVIASTVVIFSLLLVVYVVAREKF